VRECYMTSKHVAQRLSFPAGLSTLEGAAQGSYATHPSYAHLLKVITPAAKRLTHNPTANQICWFVHIAIEGPLTLALSPSPALVTLLILYVVLFSYSPLLYPCPGFVSIFCFSATSTAAPKKAFMTSPLYKTHQRC